MPSPGRRVIRFRTRGLGAFSGGYMKGHTYLLDIAIYVY